MSRPPITAWHGPAGCGPAVEGIAIVSHHGFNARYDLDRERGTFSRPGHDLFGESPAGRIYVFTTPKGGIATSWALLDLRERGLAPLALVCRRANPVVWQGAVLAGMPMIDRLNEDPVTQLCSGDRVRLDPQAGTLELLERGSMNPLPRMKGP
jgi:predicted aconitase with swiveling domain